MTLDTTKDLFFLVLSVSTGVASIFICWALYECAKMLHQANQVVTETREKLGKLEAAAMMLKEKIESSFSYFGMLAEGGKALLGMLQSRQQKTEKRKRSKRDRDDDDE